MERKMISQYDNGNIKNARRTRGFAHPRKSYFCLGANETRRSQAGSSSVSFSDLSDLEADNMFQEDIFKVIDKGWDIMIAHPPCTYLAVSGARWMYHPDDNELPNDIGIISMGTGCKKQLKRIASNH